MGEELQDRDKTLEVLSVLGGYPVVRQRFSTSSNRFEMIEKEDATRVYYHYLQKHYK